MRVASSLVRRALEYEAKGAGQAAAWSLILALCVAGFLVNYFSGPMLDYGSVFLIPCVAAGWYLGKSAGLVTVGVSAASWFAANTLHEASPPYWTVAVNTLSRFLLIALLAWGSALIRELLRRVTASSRTDPLTGLGNRRALEEHGQHDIDTASRSRLPVSVMFIDLDNFKSVNDRLGHSAGDNVLREVAAVLKQGTRRSDFAARVGGDEFAVLLIGSDMAAAGQLARKVRELLLKRFSGRDIPITLSIGVATAGAAEESFVDLLKAADKLMYEAKKGGKNGIVAGMIGEVDGPPSHAKALE